MKTNKSLRLFLILIATLIFSWTSVRAQDGLSTIMVMAIDGIIIGGNTHTEYKQLLLAHLPKLLRDDVSTELSMVARADAVT